MKPAPDYRGAALHGMAMQRLADAEKKREAQAAVWRRLEEKEKQVEEARLAVEDARLRELAVGIHTEELLQQVLHAVADPNMRTAVEARIRPYTSIPVSVHE